MHLKKYFFSSIIFAATLFSPACAHDIPDKSTDYLMPPTIVDCSQEGDYIVVEFCGKNDEYYFDGYNVYVSETSMSKAGIASYKPVEVDGYSSAEPSFPLSPDDYDPDLQREIRLYHYFWYVDYTGEYIKMPFRTGTYYILMCAHHRQLPVNEYGVSNEETIDFIKNNK